MTKEEYIAKLRSGGYSQVQGLYKGKLPNERCAVGIHYFPVVGDSSKFCSGAFPFGIDTMKTVTYMNDYEDKSFEEIADYLESL